MSKKLLLVAGLFIACAVSAVAQPITITRQNFAYPMDNDSVYSVPTPVPAPTEGADRTWDYSTLTPDAAYATFYEWRTDPAFPGASFFATRYFDVFAMNRGYFYDEAQVVNDEGYFAAGITIADQPYGIGAVTGNPLDSMNFDANSSVYESPRYILMFPVTAGYAVTSSYTRDAPLRLSIALYGLANMPGLKHASFTQVDSVVGWGRLTMPVRGGGTTTFGALLMKRYLTEVDSFYLGFQPAPEALLTAFGIAQGMVKKTGRYMLYRENARSMAMIWSYDDHAFANPVAIYYDKAIEDMTTGIETPAAADRDAVVYPNPSTTGVFMIAARHAASRIVVRNALGMEVLRRDVKAGAATVTLPTGSVPGMYFYALTDLRGTVVGTGRMLYVR